MWFTTKAAAITIGGALLMLFAVGIGYAQMSEASPGTFPPNAAAATLEQTAMKYGSGAVAAVDWSLAQIVQAQAAVTAALSAE